jgi:hypothetical protein
MKKKLIKEDGDMRALVVAAVLASVLFMGSSAVFAQYTNQPVTPENSQPGSVVPAQPMNPMCNPSFACGS